MLAGRRTDDTDVIRMLTHYVGDHCETHSIVDQIPDYAWRSRVHARTRNLGSKTLVRAFGRLWFIHESLS
jgi:hypothetical protein